MANSKSRQNIAYTIKSALKYWKILHCKSYKKQTNKSTKKLATISLTKKNRSKKNQNLLLSCLMIHSTRPQWPFLAIFVQKIFAAATKSREPHLDFTKNPIKFACTFVCRK